MKKSKFKIVGIILLFLIAAFTPSCEALLEALSEPTNQVDNNTNNNNKNTDTNGKTSKGKTQANGGGISVY